MPTLRLPLARRAPRATLRLRAELPATHTPARPAARIAHDTATHDFLVPNPRPDLSAGLPPISLIK